MGTCNGLSKLKVAAMLGMKLTEIPPYDFTRRSRNEEYFKSYHEATEGVFTTVTAHAPYYNVVSLDREAMERSWRGFWQLDDWQIWLGLGYSTSPWLESIHGSQRSRVCYRFPLKKLASEIGDSMLISVEVPYTRRMIGDWDEIKAIRE